MCVARHVQISQNNKFAISLQYLKKEMSDEVDPLHTDKDESLLQIDIMILMGTVKHSQSFKNSNLAMSSEVNLETENSIQKIQKGHFLTTRKLKKAPLICPFHAFIVSLQLLW